MTFRAYWHDLPRWARRLTIASPLLGMVFLVTGIAGDLYGLWGHWGFGANFFSSLTSALFGVPFAAILLTWFTNSQEERGSRQQVIALSDNAWTDFRLSTISHLNLLPAATLRARTSEIFNAFQLINSKVEAANRRNPTIPPTNFNWGVDADGNGYQQDLQVIYDATQSIAASVKDVLKKLSTTGLKSDPYNRDWAAVGNKWEFLNSTVRARRNSAGLDWGMPPDAEAQFVFRFKSEQSPIHPVVSILANQAAVALQALADAYKKRDNPADLAAGMSRGKVKQLDPAHLKRSGAEAARVLEELQAALDEVITAGWPGTTT